TQEFAAFVKHFGRHNRFIFRNATHPPLISGMLDQFADVSVGDIDVSEFSVLTPVIGMADHLLAT
ncbi:MAG: hypothetical protein AAF585_05050, partial [Verrucomicrobiota bacterium]